MEWLVNAKWKLALFKHKKRKGSYFYSNCLIFVEGAGQISNFLADLEAIQNCLADRAMMAA